MRHELSIAIQTDKTPSQYIALAQLINQYTFDAVSVYCDAPYHPSYGPLLLMAPHIERARLGPAAVSPFRIAPIDIAANTALLAGLARGGVYVGLARGAWLAEHGITEPARPLQAMREAAAVIRYMLTGERGGCPGEIYKLASHVSAPYPLPAGRVPVMIGTWGPKLAALAAEIAADEVKIGGSANPGMVPVMRRYVGSEAMCIVLGAVTVVDEDRAQARALARREAALYLPVVASLDPTAQVEPAMLARIRMHVGRGERDAAARLISDDLLDRFAFAGAPADIVRQTEALFAAGAGRVEFGTPHGLTAAQGIRLLGERVLPALRSRR
jgi:5,10-methylenetetrahydromethanopterin reductase